jgi:hypothetical protein
MMVRRIGNVRVTKRAMHFEEDKEEVKFAL